MPELTPEALAKQVEALGQTLAAQVAPPAEKLADRPAAVWPDDQFTRDRLAGIAATRQAADQAPDLWDGALPIVVES